MRLDKYLCDMNMGSRSVVKELTKKGNVTVNDVLVKTSDYKVSPTDVIIVNGVTVSYQRLFYYMLNKPTGYISATTDTKEKTVLELLGSDNRSDLFPVGRLDKDTEGLLLISNDGELAHNLLSPKKHIAKKYYVILANAISDEEINQIEKGIDIGEEKKTLPAVIKKIDDCSLYISITEGKYHQVKRMFQAVHNEVIYLKRIAMGDVTLDESLALGEYRALTQEELNCLKNANKGK